MKCVISYTMS